MYELILTICLQANGVECATFRQQLEGEEKCRAKIERHERKYYYDPENPPYIKTAKCIKRGTDVR